MLLCGSAYVLEHHKLLHSFHSFNTLPIPATPAMATEEYIPEEDNISSLMSLKLDSENLDKFGNYDIEVSGNQRPESPIERCTVVVVMVVMEFLWRFYGLESSGWL